MAPKRKRAKTPTACSPAWLSSSWRTTSKPRRLQIWKQRLIQLGAAVEVELSKRLTHVLRSPSMTRQGAAGSFQRDLYLLVANCSVLDALCGAALCETNILNRMLLYPWLEETLRSSGKVQEEAYDLRKDLENPNTPQKSPDPKAATEGTSSKEEKSQGDRTVLPREYSKQDDQNDARSSPSRTDYSSDYLELRCRSQATSNVIDREVSFIV